MVVCMGPFTISERECPFSEKEPYVTGKITPSGTILPLRWAPGVPNLVASVPGSSNKESGTKVTKLEEPQVNVPAARVCIMHTQGKYSTQIELTIHITIKPVLH